MADGGGNGAEVLSFGAGVNSTAMAILLIEQGWRGPIVFADPGCEWPETYCYIEYFERRYLKPRGFEVIRLTPAPDSPYHEKMSSTTIEDYCLRRGVIPLLAIRWCTSEWKVKPMLKWQKANGIATGLIGFTIDEPRRVRRPERSRYPLDEMGINRPECRRVIQRAGLEVPPKSGCWLCPGQNLANWHRLYLDHPELYERAAALERNAAERCQKWATLDAHQISLDQHLARRWQGQMEMDLSAWMPCICGI